MQGFRVHLVQTLFCAGLFAVTQTVPGANSPARPAFESGSTDLARLAKATEVARALAQGRPPVPLVRDFKYTPYMPDDETERLVRASFPVPPPVVVAATAPPPAFRRESEARWQAVMRPGSTELAVTNTP